MPKKLTIDSIIERSKNYCNSRNLTFIEIIEYKASESIIKIKCNIDGYIWTPQFNMFYKNSGCPLCARKENADNLRYSQEEFLQKVKKLIGDKFKLIFEPQWIDKKNTILNLRCVKCDTPREVTYHVLKNSKVFVCRTCVPINRKLKSTIIPKKQLDKLNKRLEETGYILLNPNFEYLGTKLTVLQLRCPIDNYIWSSSFNNFVNQKRNCGVCSGVAPLSQEEFVRRIVLKLKEKNLRITKNGFPIYKGIDTKFNIICNVCNDENPTTYKNLYLGDCGCIKCAGHKSPNLREYLKNILERCCEIDAIPLLILPYTGINTRLKLLCHCGHIMTPTYDNFINDGNNCLSCYRKNIMFGGKMPYNKKSISFLDEISKRIDYKIIHAENDGEIKFDVTLPNGKYKMFSVDGYIEKHNIIIEWDESDHKTPKRKVNDIWRENYLINKYNVRFVRIEQDKFFKDVKVGIQIAVNEILALINNKITQI